MVTEATQRLLPRPTGTPATVRAVFTTLEAVGAAVASVMAGPVTPEVMEMMDRASVDIVERYQPTGLADIAGAAVLVAQTTGIQARTAAEDIAERWRAAGGRSVAVADGDALLEARRVSGRALNARGLRASCDVAVPLHRLAQMFAAIERISTDEGVLIPTFAHAGDGNLHPSVLVENDGEAAMAEAERILHRITAEALRLGGTLSGEHGVGQREGARRTRAAGQRHTRRAPRHQDRPGPGGCTQPRPRVLNACFPCSPSASRRIAVELGEETDDVTESGMGSSRHQISRTGTGGTPTRRRKR